MMNHRSHLRVLLLPDGHVNEFASGADSIPLDATWKILGSVQQNGLEMAFVRAEIGGECWASLVTSELLDPGCTSPLITLARQSTRQREPLSGWSLFC
jgi:hypothetical protein